MIAITRFRYIEVLFHIFYYYWGKENRSLYRGLRYIKVRLIEVPLYLSCCSDIYSGVRARYNAGSKGSREGQKTGAFPCAFAFLKLSHDPLAATTVENPKKHLGTCQPKLRRGIRRSKQLCEDICTSRPTNVFPIRLCSTHVIHLFKM